MLKSPKLDQSGDAHQEDGKVQTYSATEINKCVCRVLFAQLGELLLRRCYNEVSNIPCLVQNTYMGAILYSPKIDRTCNEDRAYTK